MVSQNVESAESQASGTWANQETRQCGSYSGQPGRSGQDSRKFRGESFAPGRNDWKGTSVACKSTSSSPGEIVEQLIDETRKELEVTELHANKLRERLNTLEGLSNQLPIEENIE